MPEMCIKCDKGFACKTDLKTHMVKVHQKEQKYKKHKYNVKSEIKEWHSSKCTEIFFSHNEFLSHMTVHESYIKQEVKVASKAAFKPHGMYCLSSKKDFAGRKQLEEHFSKVHAEGKFKCETLSVRINLTCIL